MRANCVRSLGLACAAALLLAITPKVVAQAKPEVLIQGGEPADLILLYTGDVIGYLEPCG